MIKVITGMGRTGKSVLLNWIDALPAEPGEKTCFMDVNRWIRKSHQ